jgi:glutaredoxin
VRDFLTLHGVPFVERNIRKDPTARQELLERTGELIVPVLFAGERTIVGWDEEALSDALRIAT